MFWQERRAFRGRRYNSHGLQSIKASGCHRVLTAERVLTGDNRFNTEGYDHIVENPFLGVTDNPLSTFSIDVDAASYSNISRILKSGQVAAGRRCAYRRNDQLFQL
jgi:hypothetical protein